MIDKYLTDYLLNLKRFMTLYTLKVIPFFVEWCKN